MKTQKASWYIADKDLEKIKEVQDYHFDNNHNSDTCDCKEHFKDLTK